MKLFRKKWRKETDKLIIKLALEDKKRNSLPFNVYRPVNDDTIRDLKSLGFNVSYYVERVHPFTVKYVQSRIYRQYRDSNGNKSIYHIICTIIT